MTKSERGVIARMALRVLLYELAFGFVGILLVPSLLEAGSVIRIDSSS